MLGEVKGCLRALESLLAEWAEFGRVATHELPRWREAYERRLTSAPSPVVAPVAAATPQRHACEDRRAQAMLDGADDAFSIPCSEHGVAVGESCPEGADANLLGGACPDHGVVRCPECIENVYGIKQTKGPQPALCGKRRSRAHHDAEFEAMRAEWKTRRIPEHVYPVHIPCTECDGGGSWPAGVDCRGVPYGSPPSDDAEAPSAPVSEEREAVSGFEFGPPVAADVQQQPQTAA